MASLPTATIKSVCSELSNSYTTRKQYKSIWSTLNNQRRNEEFCDAIIKCKGITFCAHKNILAGRSKYFKVLFSTCLTTTETQHVANLDGFSSTSVSIILDAIYDDLHVETADISELLKVSDFLQCDWLLELLVSIIRENIDENNCFAWYEIAKDCHLETLCCVTEYFIRTNYRNLSAMEKYNHLKATINDLHRKDFDKEVVLYQNVDNGTVFAIDIAAKTVDRYKGGPYSMTNMKHRSEYTESDSRQNRRFIKLIFKHDNAYFVTCYNYQFASGGRNSFEIYAYEYTSQQYNMVYKLYEDEILAALRMEENYDFTVSQVAYDNHHSLYISICCTYQFIVFKLDLSEMRLSQSFITMYDEWLCTNFFIQSSKLGMLLIKGLQEVYNVSEFDFEDGRNHTAEPVRIQKSMQSEIHLQMEELIVDAGDDKWIAVSFNGDVYYFAMSGEDEIILSVVKLDSDLLLWVHLCDVSIPGDLRSVFCCHGKIYVVLSTISDQYQDICSCFQEICTINLQEQLQHFEEGEIHEYISCFDPDKKALTDTGISLKPTFGTCDVFIVPVYLLI